MNVNLSDVCRRLDRSTEDHLARLLWQTALATKAERNWLSERVDVEIHVDLVPNFPRL
jgi:hypothetical protein